MYKFFDKLEDKVRSWFSRRPILYGFLGGIGIVLFWRGVWHTADFVSALVLNGGDSSLNFIDVYSALDGPISFLIGSVLLLISGVFVSNFVGNEIIISGLRGEKKLIDKTEVELKAETSTMEEIKEELKKISARLDELSEKK